MSTSELTGLPLVGEPVQRNISNSAWNTFVIWTAVWWAGAGVCAVLFYIGVLDFLLSTKLALYGISIWLNGWILVWFLQAKSCKTEEDRLSLYHDAMAVWMLSYVFTNIVWEIPWIIFSPFIFENIHTIDDVIAYEPWIRESFLNMYWWSIGSFASVDLRTVNHDPTFYTLELYAFANVASTIWFFHLMKKNSPYRYLIPILGAGEPAAATFIFSFTEVFANFENMPGDVWDTLLALVWTQYQYSVFPLIFGWLGVKLFLDDWKRCHIK